MADKAIEAIAGALDSNARWFERIAALYVQYAELVREGVFPAKPDSERLAHLSEAIILANGQAEVVLEKASGYVMEMVKLTRKPQG